MSLDFYLSEMREVEIHQTNITHNLTDIAREAGIYQHLWRHEELGITHARELIGPLAVALGHLTTDPDRFRKFNPPNGWGTYEGFRDAVKRLLDACLAHPDAKVSASR